MKNKLAMFTGAYVFATVTAAVYAYQKFCENKAKCTGLKQRLDNEININSQLDKTMAELEHDLKNKSNKRVNALQDQLTVNKENWQHLFKGYEEQRDRADKSDKLIKELKQVISNQNIHKMEPVCQVESEKDIEILKLKTENSRLLEINENITQELKEAQLTIQDQDLEIKSLNGIIDDYDEISKAKADIKL